MAGIVRPGDGRSRKVSGSGSAGLSEIMIASQKDGCNRVSVRLLTIDTGGHSGLLEYGQETVYSVVEGNPLLVDGDGFVRNLSAGDFAILYPHEKHILRNEGSGKAGVLVIMPV